MTTFLYGDGALARRLVVEKVLNPSRRDFLQAGLAFLAVTSTPGRAALTALAAPAPTSAPPVGETSAEARAHENYCWFVSGADKWGVPPPYGAIPDWMKNTRLVPSPHQPQSGRARVGSAARRPRQLKLKLAR